MEYLFVEHNPGSPQKLIPAISQTTFWQLSRFIATTGRAAGPNLSHLRERWVPLFWKFFREPLLDDRNGGHQRRVERRSPASELHQRKNYLPGTVLTRPKPSRRANFASAEAWQHKDLKALPARAQHLTPMPAADHFLYRPPRFKMRAGDPVIRVKARGERLLCDERQIQP